MALSKDDGLKIIDKVGEKIGYGVYSRRLIPEDKNHIKTNANNQSDTLLLKLSDAYPRLTTNSVSRQDNLSSPEELSQLPIPRKNAVIFSRVLDRQNSFFAVDLTCESLWDELSKNAIDSNEAIKKLRSVVQRELGNITPRWFMNLPEETIPPPTDNDVRGALQSLFSDTAHRESVGKCYDRFIERRSIMQEFEKDPCAFAGVSTGPAKGI